MNTTDLVLGALWTFSSICWVICLIISINKSHKPSIAYYVAMLCLTVPTSVLFFLSMTAYGYYFLFGAMLLLLVGFLYKISRSS